MELDGNFHVVPMHILDKREVVLQKKTIVQVKVQWEDYAPYEATWEREDVKRHTYPFLFQDCDKNE